jgi:hypothetical protein
LTLRCACSRDARGPSSSIRHQPRTPPECHAMQGPSIAQGHGPSTLSTGQLPRAASGRRRPAAAACAPQVELGAEAVLASVFSRALSHDVSCIWLE